MSSEMTERIKTAFWTFGILLFSIIASAGVLATIFGWLLASSSSTRASGPFYTTIAIALGTALFIYLGFRYVITPRTPGWGKLALVSVALIVFVALFHPSLLGSSGILGEAILTIGLRIGMPEDQVKHLAHRTGGWVVEDPNCQANSCVAVQYLRAGTVCIDNVEIYLTTDGRVSSWQSTPCTHDLWLPTPIGGDGFNV